MFLMLGRILTHLQSRYLLYNLLVLMPLFFITCNLVKSGGSSESNVLFIIVDDLNDFSGAFGGHLQAKTPNIDRLAKSGLVFSNAHANSPVCSPSRNSLFTGVYPHNSKDFGWTPHYKHAVLKHNKTLVELFKENGYQTFGTGKILNKNVKEYWDEWGIDEMFNYGPFAFNGKNLVGHPSVPEPFRNINFVDGSFAPLSDIPVFPEDAIKFDDSEPQKSGWTYGPKPYNYVDDNNRDPLPDEMHAEWAVNKLLEMEKKNTKKPFFMGVGFVRPHTPLYAPKRFFDMFPLDDIKLPVIKQGDAEDCFYSSVYPPSEMGLHYYQALKESYPDGDIGLKLFLQAYLACIAFVDEQIGVVLDALDKSKFRENTIIVLTSDHGWQIGQKDYLYKNSPWEESTRVPLIIRIPKHDKIGSTVAHPVALIDLFPTFIDLCNLEGSTVKSDSGLMPDGYSLRPFLENPELQEWDGPDGALTVMGVGINKPIEGLGISRNPFALWHIEILKDLDDSYVSQQNYTFRTKDWRYILYRNGEEELYDHRNDPYEWQNLVNDARYTAKKEELRKKMMSVILNKEKPKNIVDN